MTKCFGIISWFPNKQPDRGLRQERINRFLKKINELWPDIDIMIVTQNWDEFKPVSISNKIIRDDHEIGLGILGARKRLGEVFLESDYDYLIMADDDCLIDTNTTSAKQFLDQLESKPNGFLVLEELAQLNLFCVSKYIYSQEPMVDVDPQKNEGFEDLIYTQLLKHKYAQYEIKNTANIKCLQFNKAGNEKAPSTWCAGSGISLGLNIRRANFIVAGFKDGNYNVDELKAAAKSTFPDSNENVSPYAVFSQVRRDPREGEISYKRYKETHKEPEPYRQNPFFNDYVRK